MWTSVVAVIVVVMAISAAIRVRGRLLRRRAIARIPEASVRRRADHVTMRILIQGARIWPGMSNRYANRTRGELRLTEDRFLLATNRGVLLDLKASTGRGLTSVRCTGPGRLVIEGEIPKPDGRKGLYRVDLPLPDAEEWARALRPFVRGEGAPGAGWTTRAGPSEPS